MKLRWHISHCALMGLLVLSIKIGMSIQDPTDRPPSTTVPQLYTCENITMIEFCSEIGYETASFPNYRNQYTQTAASSELENFRALVQTTCSNAVVHFLCAVYAPFCHPHQPQSRIPPCRELCEHVRSGCEHLVNESELTWPPHLECHLYPTRVDNTTIAFCPVNISALMIPSTQSQPIGITLPV